MSGASSADFAYCEQVAREHDRDRWLAALFAPAAARRHIHALTAFDHEISGVRARSREPLAGEMRLAWWREALAGARAEEARGHPIAAALLDTIETFRLPPMLFENAVAARQFDLYDDAMPSLHDLEGYCGETCSSLFQLAALILAGGRDVGAADASGHAGVAFALTRLLLGLPMSARAAFLPRDVLERHGVSLGDLDERRAGPEFAAALRDLIAAARAHLAKAENESALPAEVAPAYAPLAVVRLYLERLAGAAAAPFGAAIEVPQWRRQWALWRWARRC